MSSCYQVLITLDRNLTSAGMKLLRVWLDGQSSNQRGTPIDPFPSLEPTQASGIEVEIPSVMFEFALNVVQLLISMHSWNALDNGDPWKELPEYIFGFEAENEAMIDLGQTFIQDNQDCRAQTIRAQLGNNSGWVAVYSSDTNLGSESVQPDFLTCSTLDIVSIHAYGPGYLETSAIQPYVEQVQAAGISLLFEEWGACHYDTENNNCPVGDALPTDVRNQNIRDRAGNITAAGIPWLYWQALPNADPYIGVTDPSWDTLKDVAQQALSASAAFNLAGYFTAPQQ
ncbi:hypothetical protein OBBRIDRAFT_814478 [Obba rivulosa]|uniref:Uncharacterized protein n=1 Tax=Obba rivulosa TaxID=1052685 RepID=A0A8E2ALF4_9APHY|nr:hypothetical protein OBBRIDRAFT_814478 [Obba rivulosa]